MLQNIKTELLSSLDRCYDHIDININDIEVSTLFDQKGDFTSNICLKLSKILKAKPTEIAENIIQHFSLDFVDKIEIAGPGFLNIFITNNSFKKLLIDRETSSKNAEKINIEFVSANPTGPLHLAHGRGAIVGDVLSNLYEYFGNKVNREYYVNNTGNQIKEFLSSILFSISEKNNLELKYKQFYKGDYIEGIADVCYQKFYKLFNKKDFSADEELIIVNYAIENLVNDSIEILKKSGIYFNTISYETDIMKGNYLDEIIASLNKQNLIYKGQLQMPKDFKGTLKDNEITIFKSTNFGDDEDRALTKNDKTPTYFANDIAYHVDKHKRGFDKLINIWGADHLGYLKRLKSALISLYPSLDFSVVFCQIVNLKRNGQIQKLSKREGNIFELNLLIEEIGIDNFRYFMCYRKNDTHMDLDIDLIKKENKENPIYYIQYSYARSQSVLDRKKNIITSNVDFSKELKNLYKRLYDWDYVVLNAYNKNEVHLIAHYLESLASFFHTFWSSSKDNPSMRFLDQDNNISSEFFELLTRYQEIVSKGLGILGIKPKLKM
jgi:arginyl-tRNA synthetase